MFKILYRIEFACFGFCVGLLFLSTFPAFVEQRRRKHDVRSRFLSWERAG